jgi:PadR family transcriptional regulator PadR
MGDLPIVKGTLDLLVLRALDEDDMHGFQVTSWIEARSGGELQFDESAIYHALYRLEKRGLISADWGVTENNRRARYYHLLGAGRDHLAVETDRLVRYADTMIGILTSPGGGS